ncbi:unnamed protein product [Rodentolepis nana]|uniref:FATC domain-containing protein n=1 Tax=Rodentolepis nana TaxID=102285 RepID=A0A158QGG2_RODNA|nr:unnamed protein product [Rodentolepis nana]
MPTLHNVEETLESKARSAFENFLSSNLPIDIRLKNAEDLGEILERENEEIAIGVIKLIIEFHKANRPQFIPDVITFLVFIRQVYRNLKAHICNIFKTEEVYEVNSLVDLRKSNLNLESCSVITVKTKESGPNKIYHLIPKSSLSLKVMSEVPILIVLFYQLYKPQILDSLVEIMPLIMDFINMRPLSEPTRAQCCMDSRYLDFMAAQVKTLSFLAYIVKYHQGNTPNTPEPLHPCIESHYLSIVKGIMNLMITCPSTATNLRKEFFIATRHILNFPDIRPKFLHVIDDMMDDSVLVGEGFYFRESLRPLSYSMLGDLLHHIRNDLSLTRVSRAVDLFGKNLFDETLPFSIQMMCQRVILNLADCMRIRVMEKDHSKTLPNYPSVRRLFFQILYICVQKCRIFAECYIPELEAKCIREDGDISLEPKNDEDEFDFENGSKRSNAIYSIAYTFVTLNGFTFFSFQSPFIETFSPNQMSVNEMKSTIKVLVSGIRSVVVTLTHCPHTSDPSSRSDEDASVTNSLTPSHLTPGEVQILSDYLVCGLKLLDIFRIVSKDGVLYLRGINSGVKYPEERSVLENLANTFVPLSATSFKEIFTPMIGFIVDWCRKSPLFYAHFAYHILSQTVQTSTFGRILLSYLVERLDKIGDGNDVSFTYMRLLKFCFNSVNLPNCDNEQVMKLHLRKIVQGSMQCCLEAREPISYLSLLRALFRSIGGGAHDRLYKEFFPLLPEMLTTLNRLLRSAHRTHARDLLGELCVIVPVRLSTLLPYLSLLMEPLTYVINCNTVNQGLRTLELCVDNMQPDFLYQHLYQVRGDMLLGLYTSLHSQSEYVQKMAFKVLGKLGRFNRADISDVQRLNLSVNCGESGPLLRFWLHEFPYHPVDLPIRSLVDFSVEILQEPTVDHLSRIRAWQFLRGVCISSLNVHTPSRNQSGYLAYEFMNHLSPYPLGILREVIMKLDSHLPFHDDKPSIYHLVAVRVIGGIFLSTSVNPEIPDSGAFMTFLVRHLTLLGLLEERKATQPVISASPNSSTSDVRIPLDSRVLIEAVCFIMGYEDKDLVRTGCIIMDEIFSTATTAIEAVLSQDGSIQASVSDILPRLPMMQYFAKAITDMLYHPAWYVKWGACCTLLHLRGRISVSWFREHLVTFLRGLLHCLHDLTNQMGQGALSLAQNCLKSLIEFVLSNETSRYTQESSQQSGVIEEEPSSFQHSGKRSAATRRKSVAPANKRGGTSKRKSAIRDKEADSPIYDYMEDKDIPEITPILPGSLPLDIISQTPLINAVLNELVESLLSETKIVRSQVRNLLSVIAECLSIPLGTLLKPHIHRIDGWLPPKNRNHRLSCLPISTQIAVLETNYFLCQEIPHGAGLLHYSPSNRRCDNRFLADIRAIMEAPLPSSADIPSKSTSVKGLTPPQNICSSLQLQMVVNLKIVAAQVLSTMHYLDAQKATILGALFKGICSEDATIHKSVFESTKVFVEHSTIDMELRNTLVRPILPNFRQTSNIRLASIRQLAYCAELFPSTFSERFCETIDSILVNFVSKSGLDTPPQNLEMLSALMELFPLIPLAKDKYVHSLLSMVIKVEKQLSIEKTSPLRLPLVRFLVRYPKKAFEVVLNGFSRPDDTHAQRIILHLVTLPEGKPLLDYLIENNSILIDFIRPQDTEPPMVYETTAFFLPKFNGPLTKASTFHLGLRLVHILFNHCREWFLSIIPSGDQSILSCSADDYPLLRVLLDIWNSAFFWRRHSYFTVVKLQELQPNVALSLLLEDTGDEGKRIIPSTSSASMTSASQSETLENLAMSRVQIYEGITNLSHVVEPSALLEILMTCAETRRNDFDLLFSIVAGMSRHHCVGQNPLSRFIQRLAKEASVSWCREIFLYFVALMKKRIEASDISAAKTPSRKKHQTPNDLTSNRQGISTSVSQYLETSEAHAKLLANFITPCLFQALQTDPAGLIALGSPPKPDEPNSEDLVHILVDLMSKDQDAKKSTGLRIMYYQIASLFVYYAPAYVQDASSNVKSYRFKEITDQVQHCITSSMGVVDLQEKYMGLQVIANTIFHFYPLMGHLSGDVFQALTKGPQTEVRKMVNPAIDVLLPVWVTGPNEQRELASILKKAMQDDQSVQSVSHFLGIVLRHPNLFYPVRHTLINALIITINRLTTQTLPIDQRRMILSIIEVVVKWDMRCLSEQKEYLEQQMSQDPSDSSLSEREFALMEKPIRDQMCTFLVRYACQCMEPTPNGPTTESSAKKSLSLIETVMASDVWGGPTCDLRLGFIDRNLSYDESPVQVNPQQQQPVQVVLPPIIFMTIEVLRTVYSTLDSPTLFANIKHFSRALLNLLSRYPLNFRLVRVSAGLIKALLTKYPPEPAHRQKITNYPELIDLYEHVIKFIHEAITAYTDSTTRTPGLIPRLQSAFCLLTTTQQVQINPYAFVDRCLSPLVKLFHRLVIDVVGQTSGNSAQDSTILSHLTEIVIQTLDVLKSRLNVLNADVRKNSFGPDFMMILERSRDAKLFRAAVRILRDWVNLPKAEEHFAPSVREKVAFFIRLWNAYPRWSEHTDVAREILDCIYQVYINVNNKSFELFTKMTQAFCCAMLSPLPDIREKFLNRFLFGSDITSVDFYTDNCEMTDSKPPHTPTAAKSELFVRLLFLLESCPWDNQYYKDGFWLPIFFDVLLCDVDFNRPSVIAQTEARFSSFPSENVPKSSVAPMPLKISDLFDTTDLKPEELAEPSHEDVIISHRSQKTFELLMNQQADAFNDIKKSSLKETLRGFLNLVHLRPAIANQLFGQLWHCLWHRFLVRESCNRLPYSNVTEHPDVAANPTDTALVPLLNTTINGNPDARNSIERRIDLVKFINQFITSDAHVSINGGVPSSLGFAVASFGTTTDYLLSALPNGVLMYIANDFNQWYNMVLLLESLCARAQRALANGNYNSQVDFDLNMTPTTKADGSVGDIPLGTTSLSLLTLYDRIGEEDYPVAAWWHRLTSTSTGIQRIRNLARSQLLRFPFERHSDMLNAVIALSQGQYVRGLDAISNILSGRNSSGESAPSSPQSSSFTESSVSFIQSGDSLNKSRMYDYSLRAMKKLGDWESMESLASAITGSDGAELLGGSPLLTTLRCEMAWRNRDWSDLIATLPIVANEVPLHEQWRLALISASSAVLGRRTAGLTEDQGLDSSGNGAGGGASGGTTPGSSTVGVGGGANSVSSSAASAAGASSFPTNLLQSIESENASIMNIIIREWKRLPLIVTNQHVRLLQACQQASEIHDGNFLLVQHSVPSLNSGATSSASGASPSRIPMSQSMYDSKSIFRSWQSRGPLISDDLSFWNDLLIWRQIVVESLINSGAYSHKYTHERNTLIASCHRERAMAMLQIAKGFRKMGHLGCAQNILSDYRTTGLVPLFEKTRQEIKIKLADTSKESRLEGCDLLEKTNIQQYDKREKALFFAYKALFLSGFFKGDDATRNFGYAIQMNDNIHQVWSMFGDFLESVYTSARTSKKNESNTGTTGIFAMQALMEAATVAGTVQRKSHADLAKCIWLLTLDDAGDSSSSSSTTTSHSPTSSVSHSTASGTSTGSQTQRFARTFEERASRVHPDAFLPWLPSLAVCLLRPEGRFISSALRGIALAYPTALSSILRGLQHQLATEMDRDRRIAAALTDLSPNQRRRLDEAYSHCVDLAREDARRRVTGSTSSGTSSSGDHSQQSQSHQNLGGGKRIKKRVVVVMRGAEGEKLGDGTGVPISQSTESGMKDPSSSVVEGQEMDVDEDDGDSAQATVADDCPTTEFDDVGGVRTGYLSSSVGDGLHRVNLLFAQLRQRHPARLYVADKFVEFTAGRLLPSWSENLLYHLRKALDNLHQFAWARVSRTVRRPATSLGPFQASIQNITCPLPSWMAKELQDIVTYCGLPPPIVATGEDMLTEDAENRSGSALVYVDNIQLAYTLLANEAEADPWFKPIKEALSSSLSNIGSLNILAAISLLSKELIPMVERRVDSLPHVSYLSDRGAGNLIELISSLNVQSILSPYPRSFQNSTTSPSTSVVSAATLLELPGEATQLKFIPALHQSAYNQQIQQKDGAHHPQSGISPNPIIAANNAVANESNQPGLLYLTDILPTVIRVPSGGGRRIALRVNNGRVFHYDIPCLPREIPAGRGVSVMTADPTEACSLSPTLAAYEAWRETWCPPHLFQFINFVAARSHETAKRRINLVTPRTMDLGSFGMRLTQAGSSIPATALVAANTVAFGNPTVTGFGTLMAQQLHPQASTNVSSQSTPLTSSLLAPPPASETVPADFPRLNAFANLRGSEKRHQSTQQAPLQQTTSSLNGNSTGYAGSRGNALEVSGNPTSIDTGCYAACMSLASIIDSEIDKSSGSFTSRELITAFFERLSALTQVADPKSVNLKAALMKIFEELLQLVPQGAKLDSPAAPSIPVISDEYSGPGSVVRVWAYRRMADAESYWLFRNGVSISCGAVAAMEILFSMTPLKASGLILDPRVGRVETRGFLFDLSATPNNALNIPQLQQRESPSADLISKSSIQLANFFSSYFAPLRSQTPLSVAPITGRSTATTQPISIPSRPTSLRLTPQMSGFICLPGVPATIGPFSAAMTMLNQAIGQKIQKVAACLRTLLRDDFILWHRGRQAAVHASLLADLLAIENDEEALMASTTGSPIYVPDLSNVALMHLITLSLEAFRHRNKVLSTGDKVVNDIINASCSYENLACMDPTWLPWY